MKNVFTNKEKNFMETILSNFQCGFRKDFNTQQCQRYDRKSQRSNGFSALLNYYNGAHCLIFNYSNNRKERVKTNSSFSSFQNIFKVNHSSIVN